MSPQSIDIFPSVWRSHRSLREGTVVLVQSNRCWRLLLSRSFPIWWALCILFFFITTGRVSLLAKYQILLFSVCAFFHIIGLSFLVSSRDSYLKDSSSFVLRNHSLSCKFWSSGLKIATIDNLRLGKLNEILLLKESSTTLTLVNICKMAKSYWACFMSWELDLVTIRLRDAKNMTGQKCVLNVCN